MKSELLLLFSLGCCTLGQDIFLKPAIAQVVPDGTTNTTVDVSGNDFTINQGDRAGGNLFHSFGEFSVPTDGSAFFNNAADIVNIFSRVTGGKISNIDGLLRANGSANLFLLNPAGIIFGPGARLDIGGSFYGSSADSILFEDGEFSATDLANPPLITINAPIGLNFRDDPGEIVNQSVSDNAGLRVYPGETISFSGGAVSFDGGKATAPGGKVEVLGDIVSLINNASIDVSSETGGGTVLIGGEYQGRDALINARRTYIDDTVSINADALNNGNGGRVIVWGDEVTGFYGTISARGGDISGNGGFVEVSGQDHLIFRGNVDTSAVNGFTGTLLLDPTNITIANGSGDEAGDGKDTFAGNNSGVAGSILSAPLSEIDDTAPTTIFESELEGLSGDTNVILQATNDITIEDLADDNLTLAFGSGIIDFTADADRNGFGDFVMEDNTDTIKTNGRNIFISGANLTIGNIDTTPDNAGEKIETAFVVGNSSGVNVESISGDISKPGDVDIYKIFLTGDGTFSATTVDGTAVNTQLSLFDAEGFGEYSNNNFNEEVLQSNLPSDNALTPTESGIYFLAISEGGFNPVSQAGENIFLNDNPQAVNGTTDEGDFSPLGGFDKGIFPFDAGEYTITLTGVEGTQATFNETNQIATSGSITLNATNGNVNLANANLDSSGNSVAGGAIIINATGDITSVNGGFPEIKSFSAQDNAGGINLKSSQGSVNLTNAFFSATSGTVFSPGDGIAGNINITANSNISLTDTAIDAASFFNSGRTGDINITSENGNIQLMGNDLSSRPRIFTDTFVTSDEKTGGNITIAGESINIDNYELNASVNLGAAGNGGDIQITGGSVTIQNNALITTQTSGSGNSGSITINVNNGGALNLSDSSITASSITIPSGSVNSNAGNEGDAGNINISADEVNLTSSSITATTASGTGGSLDIKVNNTLFLRDNSLISTKAEDLGDGGNITVDAEFIVTSPNQNNDIIASADEKGTGGKIIINAESVFGIEQRDQNPLTNDINASGGIEGEVIINIPDVDITQGLVQISQNVIEQEQTTAQACERARATGRTSGLTIKGKEGMPPSPTNLFPADTLVTDDKPLTINQETKLNSLIISEIEQEQENSNYNPSNIKPITTSRGDIYPARGIIKTEDGRVILTRYPTDNVNHRIPQDVTQCNQS